MRTIGVRELSTHASEIIRNVRQQGARYIITYRGQPVGQLTPIDPLAPPAAATSHESDDVIWAELDRLGAEISHGWRVPETTAELLTEMRR